MVRMAQVKMERPSAILRRALRAARSVAALSAATAMIAGAFTSVDVARADDAVPYTDPNAVGFIGLCDASDHPIDHGSISAQPFVRSAVSSAAAPAPYDGEGRTATLFAYQPRDGSAPGEWSGQLLTASTRYTDPQHPMALATPLDDSLGTFLGAFPPSWDGLIQLRLFLGVPGQPTRTLQYAATDIRVDGDTWTVTRGGDTACDQQAGTSIEELLPTGAATPSTAAPPTTTTPRVDGGTSTATKVGIGAAVVVLLAVVAGAVARRKRGAA
ncbi:MAG: hypothetical protein JWN39_2260 [Ilumatobacteraceae bacterium]|nr:hypothetical protein [Ilumatobacteraceae bacterium]